MGTEVQWREADYPSPVGLGLGIGCVFVVQMVVIAYFYVYRRFCSPPLIQPTEDKFTAQPYSFLKGMFEHLGQVEGFVLLGGYLALTWMLNLLPASYYVMDSGGVEWHLVLLQLLLQDLLQYGAHFLEHKVSSAFYRASHKPHHRFTNPRMFDAFNGSIADTVCMILMPLFITAHLVHCNTWSYMAFGSSYAGLLTLIHAEYCHPWDRVFRLIGVGTAADHHVHHKLFVFNYGHTFMYWDRLFGTYKRPEDVRTFRWRVEADKAKTS